MYLVYLIQMFASCILSEKIILNRQHQRKFMEYCSQKKMHNETLGKDIFTFAVRMSYGYEYIHANRMNCLSACKSSSAILSLTLLSSFWMNAQNDCEVFVCDSPNIHILFCLLCKLQLLYEKNITP